MNDKNTGFVFMMFFVLVIIGAVTCLAGAATFFVFLIRTLMKGLQS